MTNSGTFLCETVANASCTARASVFMFLNRYTCVIQSEMICPTQFLTMVGEYKLLYMIKKKENEMFLQVGR